MPPAPPPPVRYWTAEVSSAHLRPSPLRTQDVRDSDVARLAASIHAVGLITPLLVRPVANPGHPVTFDDAAGTFLNVSHYEVLLGVLRHHALSRLYANRPVAVAVIVRLLTDAEALAVVANDHGSWKHAHREGDR